MILVLTAIDSAGQLREFSCPINQLEVGFDLLNDIVARGDFLVSVYIIEDNQSTSLPPDAFDGTHFLRAVQELKKEWQSILSESPQDDMLSSVSPRQWKQQRIQQYEIHVNVLKRTLERLQNIRQRVHNKALDNGAASSFVMSYYSALIDRCEVWLIKAQLFYQVELDQLNAVD